MRAALGGFSRRGSQSNERRRSAARSRAGVFVQPPGGGHHRDDAAAVGAEVAGRAQGRNAAAAAAQVEAVGRQQHQEERPDDERQNEVRGDLPESFFGHPAIVTDARRRASAGGASGASRARRDARRGGVGRRSGGGGRPSPRRRRPRQPAGDVGRRRCAHGALEADGPVRGIAERLRRGGAAAAQGDGPAGLDLEEDCPSPSRSVIGPTTRRLPLSRTVMVTSVGRVGSDMSGGPPMGRARVVELARERRTRDSILRSQHPIRRIRLERNQGATRTAPEHALSLPLLFTTPGSPDEGRRSERDAARRAPRCPGPGRPSEAEGRRDRRPRGARRRGSCVVHRRDVRGGGRAARLRRRGLVAGRLRRQGPEAHPGRGRQAARGPGARGAALRRSSTRR